MPLSPLTVLHLSDIQFGKNHRFAGAAVTAGDDAYDTLLARLIEDLKSLKDEAGAPLRPDLVLLTGDLAEWGRKSELDDALRFVRGLAEFLGLGPNRVVLIPGNHDVNRHLCAAYFETCAGNEEQPQEPFWPKWNPFVAICHDFYRDTPGFAMTPDQPWSFFELPELEAVVAALNSTMKESHLPEDHYGWVGEAQLRWFAEQLEPYRERGWWRLAAVHHNVRRGPVRDDVDWLNQKVPILATGSAAVKQAAQPPELPNQYQLVRFWPDRFRRWTRMYVPGRPRWVGDNSASPSGDSWQSEYGLRFDLPPPPVPRDSFRDFVKALSFEAESSKHLPQFTGRDWVEAKLDEWIHKKQSSIVFCLMGGPGIGKSAITCHWSHTRQDIIAFHYCVHGHKEKTEPKRILLSLIAQMAARLPEYEERLSSLSLSELKEAANADARAVFDNFLLRPLSGDFPHPNRHLLIVIDALDEAGSDEGNELASFIGEVWGGLPPWLRLVVTSRTELDVSSYLGHLHPFILNAGSRSTPAMRS